MESRVCALCGKKLSYRTARELMRRYLVHMEMHVRQVKYADILARYARQKRRYDEDGTRKTRN